MPIVALSTALTVAWVLLALAGVALVLFLGGLVATWRHTRRRPPQAPDDALPPVSLLKPMKGLEDELEANLESFFVQDYPAPFEIVFATTDADDPSLAVARRVAARHPEVPVRFVLSDDGFGLNPKVANLAGALRVARYDLVHQSDANVRVPADYLRRIVAEYVALDASVLTSPVIGVGEKTYGAAMENIQMSGFIAPAMCLALEVARITCVCGKSMLLRRSELEADLGGLESVRDVLCEDFVLGERYKALGKTVVLSPTPVRNVNIDCGPERFLGRHSRWLKMRITLHLPGFFADLLSNPVALAALALVFGGFEPAVAMAAGGIVLTKLAADLVAIRLTREPIPLRYAWLAPLKDLALFPLWVNAIFSRTVTWRGRRLRFGKNTKLLPVGPPPEPAPEEAPELHEEAA
ncbi:MAG TPA: glycosyltransferase [Polyangiaceae bacterium LLY-WYZ-15_(1-7)]|nr:glycosyl transferase [Myxococcales bacterium]MAT26345.1 glycosyl transferase [Sandaracinus sp.]HJL05265.1 glycosyltransferase [Polyangiaceae bacterium LLY-WYZ-15_(1-7)]MBJ72263.1 glycosyl transferase [Sandaracinus sp.]HJL07680.1 glycosyltransferase [Polyangiaceae bacterium LLY-WYZ-15_(1-7)]